jgi:poly(hydroxyalkanoate) depolymerase family esterase
VKRIFKALLATVVAVAATASAFALATPAAAAALTRVTSFGTNPSNLNMYVYVPDRVAAKPALLVAIHYCTGSASAVFSGYARDYVTAADKYGYVIVFPETTRSGQCFDVWSPQALTRGGGSDPVGIVSMVNYAKQKYNVDPARVFVTGFSSGAMMTNVMAAEYPDVFTAGSAFMGVPATCFATGSATSTWNSQCSGGQISKTAQQWGDAARAMYPGYTGKYPRMQLWHGSTDTTLSYNNFAEEIKQWTNLHGLSQTPALTDKPQSSWTRTRYGTNTVQAPVEGVSVSGVGHALPQSGMVGYAIEFFGLSGGGVVTPSPSSPTPSSPTPSDDDPGTDPTPSGCKVGYTTNSWSTGLTAAITITNTGTTAISGWKLGFALPSGQTITSGWNASYSPTSGQITASNVSYNATIAPNAAVGIGFQASLSGSASSPTAFTLNGASCTVA